MKAFEYLDEIGLVDAKIENNVEELKSLQELKNKAAAVLVKSSGQTGENSESIECMIKIEKAKEIIEREIIECMKYKNEAQALIEKHCSPDCAWLLYLRYFTRATWKLVAEEMYYSYRWVVDVLHKKALAQLQDAIDSKSNA